MSNWKLKKIGKYIFIHYFITFLGEHSNVNSYNYNSVLKCQHAILKSGASTPRTVTKFAVKTAIDLTSTIKGWNFNFRSISIVVCGFFEQMFLTGG